MRVSVIGGGTVPDERTRIAEEVGRLLAERGHTLVCGGLGGVMESACRGAKEGRGAKKGRGATEGCTASEHPDADGTGGKTIGILPGEDCRAANPFVDVPIATGLGHARRRGGVRRGGRGVRMPVRTIHTFLKSPLIFLIHN